MTQAEAKNAVKHIRQKIEAVKNITDMLDILEDVRDLEKRMNERQQATPNARPATKEELSALCMASNVVAFRPAA